METVQHNKVLRWITFTIVMMNILFIYLSNYFPTGTSMNELLLKYPELIIPVNYLLVVWGIVSFSFMIYSVYQLLPAQHDKPLYDNLAIPFILVNLMSSLWVICLRYEYITFSLVLTGFMALVAFMLFRRIKRERNLYRYSSWLMFPFSVYFGLVMIAAMMNLNVWLATHSDRETILSGTVLSSVLTVVLLLAGLAIGILYRDSLFPLTISIALVSVWLFDGPAKGNIAALALVAGIVLLAWTVQYMIRTHQEQKRLPCYTGRSVMKIVR